MNIRPMTKEDYNDVYSLWANSFGVVLSDIDDTFERISKFLIRNPSTCFLAESGEGIIGTILSGHDGRRGNIYHLTVRHDYRKNGIGKSLVERAIIALKEEGINKVALLVFHTNDSGNRFWESIGFREKTDAICRSKQI